MLRTRNLVSDHLMGETPVIAPELVCESVPFSSLSLKVHHVPILYSTAFPKKKIHFLFIVLSFTNEIAADR